MLKQCCQISVMALPWRIVGADFLTTAMPFCEGWWHHGALWWIFGFLPSTTLLKLWFSVISTNEVNNYTLPRLFLWLLDSCQQKNINIPDCLKYFFNKRVFHDDCLDSKGYLTIKYPKDTVSFVCMQVSGIFYQQSWPFTFCFFHFFVGRDLLICLYQNAKILRSVAFP